MMPLCARRAKRRSLLMSAVGSLLSAACGSEIPVSPPPSPAPPASPAPLPPFSVSSTGNGVPFFVWPRGTVAPASTFLVVDRRGNPLPDVVVHCAVSGGGSLTRTADTTNAEGVAWCGDWMLNAVAGINTLTATVASLRPWTVSVDGVDASPRYADGKFRLEDFNGGPLPSTLEMYGDAVELVSAELTVADGTFELFWFIRAPGGQTTWPIRTVGAVAVVGQRLSLVTDTARTSDSWALALASGELLVWGDDEYWPMGPSTHRFRRVR